VPWIFVQNVKLVLLLYIFHNLAKLSGSGRIFAEAGFLLDLEKIPDSGQSQTLVQRYIQLTILMSAR